MILVDTSAWLDFFRGVSSPMVDQVEAAVDSGEAAITGLILTELLQGARHAKEYRLLKELFTDISTYFEPPPIWRKAGEFSLRLRKSGVEIKTVDMIIAAMALENDLPLLTKDSDFLLIAKHLPLKLLR